MTFRIREDKFLHRRSVGRVLYHGSIKDCADLLLGIKHHNDSLNKGGEVPTSCKRGEGPLSWKRRRLYRSIVVYQAP